MDITECGDLMINTLMDEWGRRKIDGLLEDGTKIIIVVVLVETVVAKDFPMNYLAKPAKAQMLISKVEGATITKVVKDYPEILIKKNKAEELRSKFS